MRFHKNKLPIGVLVQLFFHDFFRKFLYTIRVSKKHVYFKSIETIRGKEIFWLLLKPALPIEFYSYFSETDLVPKKTLQNLVQTSTSVAG